MAKTGTKSLLTNQYFYMEGNSGQSAAAGVLTSTGHYRVVLSATAGATPAGSNAIFDFDPGVNGNLTVTPNGTGSMIITDVTVQGGTIDATAIGSLTPSSGVFTSVDSDTYLLSTVASLDGQVMIGRTDTGVPLWANITAGTNVSIVNAAGSITINAASGAVAYAYTLIDDTDSPYTVLAGDYYISADTTAAVISVLLPDAPTTGRVIIIKDHAGTALTNPITVTTVGGVVQIDGGTSYAINNNNQAISVIFNGTSYQIF